MKDELRDFTDEFSNLHQRGPELGRGGQGVVFRTFDADIAIKLALDGDGQPIKHAKYIERLRRVRALPLPPGIRVSTPVAVLKDTAGYVMRLLNHMEPFSAFWEASDLEVGRPDWLSGMPDELAACLLRHRDTGALRRRLMALYGSACVLARLHGVGLVYGDVSPNNAFVAKGPEPREVWLIDADNLRFETRSGGRGVYTPAFGAPEVVTGRDGGRLRTDCHAFAVMAFWMLTDLHPFIGEYVEAGGDADWADDSAAADIDDQAYAGRIPWIRDEEDDLNHKDNGLIDLMLTEELMSLCQATFGPGRTKPWLRPTMFQWAQALAQAVDASITCGGCGMGYYVELDDDEQRCPFCQASRPQVLAVVAYGWAGARSQPEQPVWSYARHWGCLESAVALPGRVLYPFSVEQGDEDELELIVEEGEVRLTRLRGSGGRSESLSVASGSGADAAFLDFAGTAVVPLQKAKAGFWLYAESSGSRVLFCRILQGTS